MRHSEEYPELTLENQLCFPLYACARAVTGKYKPLLDKLDLTYTQYLTMMVLWEHEEMTSKEIGKELYLDSGTLTPLLKKLEIKGYVHRLRSTDDERNLMVRITEKGMALRSEAREIPYKVGACLSLSAEEAQDLHKLLYKLIENTHNI